MFIKYDKNDYGTPVSRHRCDTCGAEFTVCPASEPERFEAWNHCLSPNCDSYDPDRDADKFFEDDPPEGARLIKGPPKAEA